MRRCRPSPILSLVCLMLPVQDGLVGHVPSHGCGPNPLVLLLSEMPVWLQRTLALTTNGDMMRTIRSDENIRRSRLEVLTIVCDF